MVGWALKSSSVVKVCLHNTAVAFVLFNNFNFLNLMNNKDIILELTKALLRQLNSHAMWIN